MTEIIIPDTVTTLEPGCLGGCKTLTKLTVPFTGKTIDSQASTEGVFASLFDSHNAGVDYEYKSRPYKTGGYTMYRSIPVGLSEVTVTKKLSPYGFCGCGKITKINLAEGITTIPNYAFYQCEGLQEVSFPSTLTTIESLAFAQCTSLVSINIPNTITSIGSSAFSSCDKLEEVTIPDSVTSISQQTFWSCDALHTVNLPATVTYLASDIFGYCSNLTSINFAGTMAQWSAISKINWKRNNSTITQVVCSDGTVTV